LAAVRAAWRASCSAATTACCSIVPSDLLGALLTATDSGLALPGDGLLDEGFDDLMSGGAL
jgi:hypothetical protein